MLRKLSLEPQAPGKGRITAGWVFSPDVLPHPGRVRLYQQQPEDGKKDVIGSLVSFAPVPCFLVTVVFLVTAVFLVTVVLAAFGGREERD